jgi:hypothetical protein
VEGINDFGKNSIRPNYAQNPTRCYQAFREQCVGFAIKLNLHGFGIRKIKSDDYIKIKGTTTLLSTMVEQMRGQPGYHDVAATKSGAGADMSTGKTLVTLVRVARAFAPHVINL